MIHPNHPDFNSYFNQNKLPPKPCISYQPINKYTYPHDEYMDTVDYDNFNNFLRMHDNYNEYRENTHSNSSSHQDKKNLKSGKSSKEPHMASPWQSSQGSHNNNSYTESHQRSQKVGKGGTHKNKNIKPLVNPWDQSYPGSHGVPKRGENSDFMANMHTMEVHPKKQNSMPIWDYLYQEKKDNKDFQNEINYNDHYPSEFYDEYIGSFGSHGSDRRKQLNKEMNNN